MEASVRQSFRRGLPLLVAAGLALAARPLAAAPAAAPANCPATPSVDLDKGDPISQIDAVRQIEHRPDCFKYFADSVRGGAVSRSTSATAKGRDGFARMARHLDALAAMPQPMAGGAVNVHYIDQIQAFLNGHETEPAYQLLQIAVSDVVAASDALGSSDGDADKRKQLSDMLVHLQVLRDNANPYLFHLDTYTAVEYSNLFRDRTADTSFFGTGKPFYLFEANQLIALEKLGMPATYCISAIFRPTPIANPQSDLVASSASVSGEIGGILWLFGDPRGTPGDSVHAFTLGVHVGVGMEALPRPEAPASPAQPNAQDNSDNLLGMWRAAFVYRATRGVWQGTNLEVGYAHDPRFLHSERLIATLRVVLTPSLAGSVGKGLGAFVEIAGNRSLMGRGTGETRLMAGVRIDTLSVLRAIIGAAAEASPSSQ